MIRRFIIVADDSLKGCDEAIEKLEREWGAEEIEPCEDCISREDVLKYQHIIFENDKKYKVVFVENIENLPSVTPTIPDVENNYNIGYNCGYADAMSDIADMRGDAG